MDTGKDTADDGHGPTRLLLGFLGAAAVVASLGGYGATEEVPSGIAPPAVARTAHPHPLPSMAGSAVKPQTRTP